MEGITLDVLASALAEARKARQHILAEMTCCKPPPRGALAPNAPRIRRFTVDTDKLGMLIGPGGRNIRGLIEESGADEIKVSFQPCLSELDTKCWGRVEESGADGVKVTG